MGNTTSNDEVIVMFERMRGDIQLIADQYGGLTKRFDTMDQRFDKFESGVNEKFEITFQYLSRIEDEVVGLGKDLEELTKTKKYDKKVLNSFETRITVLEKNLLN